MTELMFKKIEEETNRREMPFSEYIREAIELKIKNDEEIERNT